MNDLLSPTEVDTGLKIVRLEAENIKRLSAVEIRPDGNLVEITGRNAQGKQQPLSEPVLTPAGWRPIGEIKAGDAVVGSSGQPTQVLGVFPQAIRDTYRVTMADGAWTRCGPEHLWTVSRWNESNGGKDRVTATLSTADLLRSGLRRGTGRKYALPVVGPVQFADTGEELPIDPYTLGVILGDGHIEPSGYVTVTSWDAEVLDAIAPPDCWCGPHEVGSAFWSRPLRHMGLGGKPSWEKFVPDRYLWAASADARRALLSGLLDSDGTAPQSWAQFCSTSEQLADAVVHLASSLGWVCKKRGGVTKKYRYEGELKEGRVAWLVSIKSNCSPFTLRRKTEAWSPSEQRGERWRFIDTIERVEDEDSVCIKVAAEDGLYVTRDFILTHNTSVLDAIWWAMKGRGAIQSSPIRRGQEEAHITLDLGKITIRRRFKAAKEGPGFTTDIRVEAADGFRAASPQALLDGLMGELSIDPLAFMRMEGKPQLDMLRGFVKGFDFDENERDRKAAFEKRTEVNRDAKQARAAAREIVVPSEMPAEMIDETALTNELAQAGEHNAGIETRRHRRETALETIAAKRDFADNIEDALPDNVAAIASECVAKVAELEQQIAQLQARIVAEKSKADQEIEEERSTSAANAAQARADADALQAKLDDAGPLPDPIDIAALTARMSEARNTNAGIRQRNLRDRQVENAKTLEKQAQTLTDEIAAFDKARTDAIAAAELPVDGIEFGDGVLLLNGLPLDQASDAEQLRVSVAIAMSMHPRLRVIRVRDGNVLDADGMKLLAELGQQYDCQVWIETVRADDRIAFVIEDGRVREPEPAAA